VRLLGGVSGSASFSERYENESNANKPDTHGDDGGDAHGPRPSRHRSLGAKIMFVALALSGVIAYFSYALKLISRGERPTAIFCAFLGAAGILVGLCVSFLLISGL
jgi:hypothetical protein